MALTATMTVSNGPYTTPEFANTPLSATLTLSNSVAGPVTVTAIQPFVTGGTLPYTQPSPPVPITVPGLGSSTLNISFFAPAMNVKASPSSVVGIAQGYTIGAIIYSNDATNPVLSPTPIAITPTSGNLGS
ncbi:MAG TPA: hypothetical protein VMT56_00315 [Candidatus Bathyarchaeia archaeon]|nr:hypothetical protein [Candidatus Bathyarchaeia archaeon]